VAVLVHDDGDGFDLEQTSSGFGLLGMRERLALVDGTLCVDSTPGAGTTLQAAIPVRLRSSLARSA
jgi:signal transduction histidine kinase